MNTTDPEVREYLAELQRALAGRPDQEPVLEGVRQHIDDAVAGGVPVGQVLEDLGDPLAIAAESSAPTVDTVPPLLQRRSGGVLVALLIALGGVVVPVLGWIVGVVLMWLSPAWRIVDKVVVTLAPLLGFALVVVPAVLLRSNAFAPVHAAILFGPILGAVASAVYLLVRFRPAR